MRILVRFSAILIALLLITNLPISSVIAQDDDLPETFVSASGVWQVNHPSDWHPVAEVEFDAVEFDMGDFLLFFFGPDFSGDIVALAGSDDIEQILAVLLDLIEVDYDDIETGDFNGRDQAFTVIEDGDGEFVIAVVQLSNDLYGAYGLETEETLSDEVMDTIFSIILSFSLTDDEGPAEIPSSLQNHAGDWQDAVAELEELGLISEGGSLVFVENTAFFTGSGNFFTPLARQSPHRDIVMAGELTFTTSDTDDLEICSLISRTVTNAMGDAVQSFEVALTNVNMIAAIDSTGPSEHDVDLRTAPFRYIPDEPYHILYVAIRDRVYVYLNGELIISDFEIENRSGAYGIALRGQAPGARCEGNNIWVYQAPFVEPGVCEINATSNVNRRSGPGTNFNQAGQLSAGTILLATGQAESSDGFTWWQLEDDTWVRDDVVNASGDCANIPGIDD